MGFRDIKTHARKALHAAMQLPAICYPDGPMGPSFPVTLRLNSKAVMSGDLAGTSLSYAQSSETEPRLIFLVVGDDAVPFPRRGQVYCVEANEAYRVDHTEPLDVLTVTAVCVRLSDEDAGAYQAPTV